jgi:hypothetical protein
MAQMPEMILAYMRWCDPEEGGSPISDTDEDTEVYSILVIDMFGSCLFLFFLVPLKYV